METSTEELKRLLRYDQNTGEFFWLIGGGRRRLDRPAGCNDGSGYTVIRIAKKKYKAHRLAWIFMHGASPEGMIDHINGQTSDNRIINLRVVTRSINAQNQRRARAGSKSGLLGVSPYRSHWQAAINDSGKQIHLGYFDDPKLAHSAYLDAKRRLHIGCTI